MHNYVLLSQQLEPIGYVVPSATGGLGMYMCDYGAVDANDKCICDHSTESSCKRFSRKFKDWWRQTGSKYLDPNVPLPQTVPLKALRLPALVQSRWKEVIPKQSAERASSSNPMDVDQNTSRMTLDQAMESLYLFCPELRNDRFKSIFFRSQLEMAAKPDKHGFRWPPEMIDFAHAVVSSGGPHTLQVIRGIPSKHENGGHLLNKLEDAALFFPSLETVRNALPPVLPGCHSKAQLAIDVVTGIRNTFAEENSSFKPDVEPESMNYGCLCFDEMDIAVSIRLLKWLNLVVGLVGDATPVSEIYKIIPNTASEEFIKSKLGTKVCQFFYTSCNGWGTYPMNYITTNSISAAELYKEVTEFMEEFLRYNFLIIATSSDCFPTVEAFITLMEGQFG